jgi:hypothetical protein
MSTTNQATINLIKSLAPHHNLPWELVAAIVWTESNCNTWAYRYEPQYKYLVGTEDTLTATERVPAPGEIQNAAPVVLAGCDCELQRRPAGQARREVHESAVRRQGAHSMGGF